MANPHKALRLTVTWSGAMGRSAAELEELLAAPARSALVPEEPTADPRQLDERVAAAKAKLDGRRQAGELPPPPPGSSAAGRIEASSTRIVRDPNIIAWVLMAADGVCEVCDEPAPFRRANGDPFLEVHHLRPLAEGGPDQTDNAAATCPNCHRRLHFSADRDELRLKVIAKVQRLADYPAAEEPAAAE